MTLRRPRAGTRRCRTPDTRASPESRRRALDPARAGPTHRPAPPACQRGGSSAFRISGIAFEVCQTRSTPCSSLSARTFCKVAGTFPGKVPATFPERAVSAPSAEGDVLAAVAQRGCHPDQFVQKFVRPSDEGIVEQPAVIVEDLADVSDVDVPENRDQSEFAQDRQ